MTDISLAQQINRRASKKNIPLSVLIELTYRCNVSCYYCYQQSLSKEKELSQEEWSGVLAQLAEAGTLYITFSGGEWLVRTDALAIIADARARDFAVSIITNGTLLSPSIVSQLVSAGIMDIGVSFLAAKPALHDRLSGKKGSYALALKGLRFCIAAGIKTIIKHTVSSKNFGEFVDLAKLAENEGCLFECDANVVSHKLGEPSPFALTIEQYSQFLQTMKVSRLPATLKQNDLYTLHCDAGRSVCGITPSGNVVPCIQLPLVFGNLGNRTFKQVWNGKEATRFRSQEKKLDKSCTYCSLRRFCNRCAGIVFFETGGKWQGPATCLCNRAAAMAGLTKSFFSQD